MSPYNDVRILCDAIALIPSKFRTDNLLQNNNTFECISVMKLAQIQRYLRVSLVICDSRICSLVAVLQHAFEPIMHITQVVKTVVCLAPLSSCCVYMRVIACFEITSRMQIHGARTSENRGPRTKHFYLNMNSTLEELNMFV